ncbi:MAG: preprotein translocase subunit YajC [Actinomycetaceae bacterium]|nr:preprotein translocase subunit YajC [Actinomycetaceae bacterium]
MPSNLTPFIFLIGLVFLMLWMSYSSRKARERMARERDALIKLGADVMTTAGFYGTIVDIDGDAITLQSPAGDETVWDRKAIAKLARIPLAEAPDDVEAAPVADEPVSDSRAAVEESPANDDEADGPASPFSSDKPTSPFSSK